MNIQEPTGLKGTLRGYMREAATGIETDFVNRQNLIVDAAKTAWLSFLYNPGAVVDVIDNFKIGDGGTLDVDGQFPKAEDPAQTDLHNVVLSSSNINFSNPTPTSVQFAFDVLTGEANGLNISEVALFKNSGAMFNVKNFVAVPKNSGFSLHFEWTIEYV